MMKITISRHEAHTLSAAMIGARSFMGIAVDGAEYLNSAWLCILGGFLLALPLGFAVDWRAKKGPGADAVSLKVICAIFAIIAIYESAAILRMLVNTTSYCELSTLPASALMIFIMLCVFYCLTKNGRGCGNAAKIWVCAFILIMAIVIVAQMRAYNPMWLTPVFAPGLTGIIEGSVISAGYFAAAAMVHLSADGEYVRGASCVFSMAVGALTSAILCALRAMLAPAMVYGGTDRLIQLDTLLANGRSALTLQLPLMYVWFSSLLVAITGYGYVAARYAQRLAPRADGRAWSAIVLAAALAVGFAGWAESGYVKLVGKWEYIAIALPMFAALTLGLFIKAGKEAKA